MFKMCLMPFCSINKRTKNLFLFFFFFWFYYKNEFNKNSEKKFINQHSFNFLLLVDAIKINIISNKYDTYSNGLSETTSSLPKPYYSFSDFVSSLNNSPSSDYNSSFSSLETSFQHNNVLSNTVLFNDLNENKFNNSNSLFYSSTYFSEYPDSLPTLYEMNKRLNRNVKNLLKHSKDQINIEKLAADSKKYAFFTLPTNLNGIAISEPDSMEGGFAISVGCGYYHDSPFLPGTAHLLEHMIFLGSNSSNIATQWDNIVSSVKGHHNAETNAEHTTYYVIAPSPAVPYLLKIFLEHLFHPALDVNQFETEVVAVEFEHVKNKANSNRVLLELAMYLTQQSNNPAKKFGTGSFNDLCLIPNKKKLNVINSLKLFHQKCYTQNNMSIAVKLGKKNVISDKNNNKLNNNSSNYFSLNDIQDIITDAFSQININDSTKQNYEAITEKIKNKSDIIDYTKTNMIHKHEENIKHEMIKKNISDLFSESKNTTRAKLKESKQKMPNIDRKMNKTKCRLIKVAKKFDWTDSLILYFEIKSDIQLVEDASIFQVFSIFNHLFSSIEENSLITTLKNLDLVLDSEYIDYVTSYYSLVGISFTLTKKGYQNYESILVLFNEYLDLINKEINESYIEKVFNEIYRIQDLKSKLKEQFNLSEILQNIASHILMHPNQAHLAPISSHKMFFKNGSITMEQIKKVQNLLQKIYNQDNFNAILIVNPDELLNDHKESMKAYDLNYSIEHLELKPKMENLKKSFQIAENLKIPRPLNCKVMNLTIIADPEPEICTKFTTMNNYDFTVSSSSSLNDFSAPCVLSSSSKIAILWKGSLTFSEPIIKSFFKMRIKSDDATISNALYGKLHSIIIAERIKNKMSHLNLCGVMINIDFNNGAFVFEISTFSEIYSDILKIISDAFAPSASVSQSEFDKALEKLTKNLSKFSDKMAFDIAIDIATSFIMEHKFSQMELHKKLTDSRNSLTFQEYKNAVQKYLHNFYMDAFVVGNIGATDAKKLIEEFHQKVTVIPIDFEISAHNKVIQLTKDIEIRVLNPILKDTNSALVELFLTPTVPDALDGVIYSIIGDLVSAPFFDQIRTTWMDGYVAFANVHEIYPIMALLAVVQGTERTVDELDQHVCSILDFLENKFEKMSSLEDLKKKLKWIGASKYRKHKFDTLDKYYLEVVEKISTHNFCFKKEMLAQIAIKKLYKCPSLLFSYMKNMLKLPTRRKITVKLIGTKNLNKDVHLDLKDKVEVTRCNVPEELKNALNNKNDIRRNPKNEIRSISRHNTKFERSGIKENLLSNLSSMVNKHDNSHNVLLGNYLRNNKKRALKNSYSNVETNDAEYVEEVKQSNLKNAEKCKNSDNCITSVLPKIPATQNIDFVTQNKNSISLIPPFINSIKNVTSGKINFIKDSETDFKSQIVTTPRLLRSASFLKKFHFNNNENMQAKRAIKSSNLYMQTNLSNKDTARTYSKILSTSHLDVSNNDINLISSSSQNEITDLKNLQECAREQNDKNNRIIIEDYNSLPLKESKEIVVKYLKYEHTLNCAIGTKSISKVKQCISLVINIENNTTLSVSDFINELQKTNENFKQNFVPSASLEFHKNNSSPIASKESMAHLSLPTNDSFKNYHSYLSDQHSYVYQPPIASVL